MTLTLLLDLDDTLLDTNLESFVPAYFQALSKHLARRVSPEIMLPALMSATRLMNESEDFTRTLKEVFDQDFYPKIGLSPDDLAGLLDDFYDNVFPSLGSLTRPRPDAASFVEWAFRQGFRLAIATDPLLPLKATRHRVRWAGFDPAQFELISAFEHFHFSKTYPAYYAEMLGRMGWPDGPVLMVGNDMQRDILPAQRLGLKTYHVDGSPASGSGPEADLRGNLFDLRLRLESADLSMFEPDFKSPQAILAILSASPAVLRGMSLSRADSDWSREPTPGDWALIEIVCHLRDTEREIHHAQIRLFAEQGNPFIPRPDAAVWARERKYLNENGLQSLRAFAAARRETLSMLSVLNDADWMRPARHAIFGPTNFREVIGFMADHDRLHIQQAWKTLSVV
jgi:FMN phosphatase YigB (HAD superfamily)